MDDDEVASSYAQSQSESIHCETTTTPSTTRNEDSSSDDGSDAYSDEFEAGDSDERVLHHGRSSSRDERDPLLFRVGDSVQVYWEDEGEWFYGVIAHTTSHQCFVHYTDGEQQWEPNERMRSAPSGDSTRSTEQLQLVVATSVVLTNRRVLVYWHDEASWFEGRVTDVSAAGESVERIHIVYDDGDAQWIPRAAFRDVLLLSSASSAHSCHQAFDKWSSIVTEAERTLFPRKYTPVESSHFEPVRVAQPYRCSVRSHIGSIVTPRRRDSLQLLKYYNRVDVKLDFEVAQHGNSLLDPSTATCDCEIQTEISVGTTTASV